MTDIQQQQQQQLPINVIKGLFPNVKEETIHSVLQKYHYDLLNSLHILDRLESECYDYFDQPDEDDGTRRKDICVYDLQGVCLVKDECKYLHVNTLPHANACKYTLFGCQVKNCPYRHTTGTIICKHWLLGSCFNPHCNYSHQFDDTLNLIEDYYNNPIQQQQFQLDQQNQQSNNYNNSSNNSIKEEPKEEDFPVLGSPIKKPSTPISKKPPGKRKKNKPPQLPINNNNNNNNNNNPPVQTPTTTTTTAAATNSNGSIPIKHTIVIIEEIKPINSNGGDNDDFPSLSSLSLSSKSQKPKVKRNTYTIDGSSFVQIQNLKNLFTNVEENNINREFINNNQNYEKAYESLVNRYGKPIIKSINNDSIENNSNNSNSSSKHYSVFDLKSYNKGWVETGVDVSLLYKQHREKAILHARERNRLFNQAARAFSAQSVGEAREYSIKAREHDEIMKDYNNKARDIIFSTRNKDYDRVNNNILDFHGLHVIEALEILKDHLNNLPLKVIVGTGHHSTSSSRLPTKIKQYLTANGLNFKDISTDKRGGLLLIFK